jgi:hypothetical protein
MTQSTDSGSGYRTGTLVATGVLGAILGSAGCGIYQPLVGGDEPPIRVRNGSIYMELVHSTNTWVEETAGDKKNWKMTDGERTGGNDNNYEVYFAPSTASYCKGLYATPRTIRFNFSDKNWVEFKVTGNHTRVKSDPNDLSSNGKQLTYGAGDRYIVSIVLDNDDQNPFCSFNQKDNGLRVALIDP